MTDPRPPDELVSAVLDGVASPEEIAALEREPALRARLDSFRAVRRQLSVPIPPPPDASAAAVARALAELVPATPERERPTVPGVGTSEREPFPLPPPRRRAWSVAGRVLAAAAVVMIFAGVVSVLNGTGDGDDSDAAGEVATTAAVRPEAADGRAGTTDAQSSGGDQSSTTAGGTAPETSVFPPSLNSVVELESALGTVFAAEIEGMPDRAGPEDGLCSSEIDAAAGGRAVIAVEPTTSNGRKALAVAFRDSSNAVSGAVLDVTTCRVLLTAAGT